MKCKHCIIEIAKIGDRWEHIVKDGVTFHAVGVPDGHPAEPRYESVLLKRVDGAWRVSCMCGWSIYFAPVTEKSHQCAQDAGYAHLRTHEEKPRTSYPLFIYIHAWERHESTTEKMRDYLRGVWQSAGHATAVEV